MPWCPKCKNEYRAGITVCADCKVDLVEELTVDPKEDCEILVALEKEEDTKKLISYLEYSSITAFYEQSENPVSFIIYVPKKMLKQAKKAFTAFYTVETISSLQQEQNTAAGEESDADADSDVDDSDLSETDLAAEENVPATEETEEDEDEDILLSGGSATYTTKAEKSADYRSTGFTFTIFGILGLGVMLLHWLNIFQYFTTMSAVIMTVMFAAFIFIGIDSFRRAKKAAAESVDETNFTKQLTEWLDENLTLADLKVADKEEATSEINFLNELNEMKHIIVKQFGSLDSAFLDQFCEDYYNEHFAENDAM